jgi:signal transduction histidine kinase
MRRPWQVWFVFALSVAAMIPALLWLSFRTMALEKDQLLARAKAAQEENIASVLLRLDSQVSPLLLREFSRPYHHYEPVYKIPATNVALGKNEDTVLVIPSPLVQDVQPGVLLHCEVFADGEKCCPEVMADDVVCQPPTKIPADKIRQYRQRFAEIANSLNYAAIALRLERAPETTDAANYAWQAKVTNYESQRQQRLQQENIDAQLENSPYQSIAGQGGNTPQQAVMPQAEESLNRAAYNQSSRGKLALSPRAQSQEAQVAEMAASPEEVVREGSWEPLWHAEKLLLVRPVKRKRLESLQICWLDWDAMRPKLLEEARTLIPEANLRAVDTRDLDEKLLSPHLMATLPLSLVVSPPVVTAPTLSPTIIMAWAGFLMAAVVVGLLLFSVISLSERRAAFVTSVTHELRTPLTTFRMYSEMLAEGMVPDEASRKRYLNTLRTEADRLGHLVENVLSYARLERGRGGKTRENVAVRPLLERTVARMSERALQADKSLSLIIDESLQNASSQTDPGAVEQIVMNLIDNACKYANPATDSRIIVRLSKPDGGSGICVSVRDFGPGIARGWFTGLFQPFSKTAQEAAVSAPGVGLGLALCCRLAKQLGGRLIPSRAEGGGALMELYLP